jgi:L-ascorbate metabolism protein UlaG (beta-lactamase superfamily)
MHVTFLGHAQLLVKAAGKTLLIDPWFAEPVFAGAWWRYPPPPYPTPESLPAQPDFLVLSHAHPDHSGPGTLALLNPALPTLAPPFPEDPLPRRLERAGFRDVLWMEGWKTREISPGLKVTYVPHDRGWKVSSIVIEADGVRLYHGNDNPLTLAGYQELARRMGTMDIAFLPFAGASSYPTCFEWDSRETMLSRARQKKQEGVTRLTDGIQGLEPRRAVPFASSWALFEEEQLWKNYVDRPTVAEAIDAAGHIAARHETDLLQLQPGDEWSPERGVIGRGLTAGWGHDAESIARYARTQRERVAQAVAARHQSDRFDGDAARLDKAVRLYLGKLVEQSAGLTKDMAMVAGFVADGPGGGAWHVIFQPGAPPRVEQGRAANADETLTLEAHELWSIATTPASWEDGWYGYRLRVRKREGAGYYRPFWEMLLGVYDEDISAWVREQVARR